MAILLPSGYLYLHFYDVSMSCCNEMSNREELSVCQVFMIVCRYCPALIVCAAALTVLCRVWRWAW